MIACKYAIHGKYTYVLGDPSSSPFDKKLRSSCCFLLPNRNLAFHLHFRGASRSFLFHGLVHMTKKNMLLTTRMSEMLTAEMWDMLCTYTHTHTRNFVRACQLVNMYFVALAKSKKKLQPFMRSISNFSFSCYFFFASYSFLFNYSSVCFISAQSTLQEHRINKKV